MTAKFTIPKTLGACADKCFTLRKKRLELEAQAEEIKKEESAIKEYLIQNLPKSSAEGIMGKLATAKLNPKIVAQVKDWDAFYPWIAKTKAWDVLQRRVNDAAVRDRWENKVVVPGVEPFKIIDVNITKR